MKMLDHQPTIPASAVVRDSTLGRYTEIGKDTLLRAARNHFSAGKSFGFARRYITRPPQDNY